MDSREQCGGRLDYDAWCRIAEARPRLVALCQQPNEVVVLDVRTPEEYAERHIVNARLLTLDTIDETTAAEAAPDKEAPVFVYCRTGVRSAEAALKLEALGYRQIYDFGGIMDWPYATIDGDEPTAKRSSRRRAPRRRESRLRQDKARPLPRVVCFAPLAIIAKMHESFRKTRAICAYSEEVDTQDLCICMDPAGRNGIQRADEVPM